MADKDAHLSKRPLTLLDIEQYVGEGERLRRFSLSGLIHRIAIETSGSECFAETKQIFFRAAASMSEQGLWMRTRRCGENSKRRYVCGQHYFFHANAGLDHVG